MKLIRTGVIGTGYLGKFHADKYSELIESELVGIVDTDYEAAQTISNRLNVPAFKSYEELFDRVDAVSIVVPTELHHKIAKDFLLNGIDVLVEKPMTTTLEEAEDLIETAKKNKCVLQVGHLERFNAAVLALNNVIKQPLFIESHRLAPFKYRGTDVDVILDIMIHDIDIILNIVGSPVKAIHAVGVPVVSSENNDIANVRLEFESGCVANVTASRISAKEMRKIRIFQHDKYLSIDYAAQQVEVYGKTDSDEHDTPQITYDQIDIKQGDSLKEEIRSFLNAVKSRSIPEVPGEAGKNALKVALEIVEQIETKKTTLKI